jgi:hypothetical protein
MIKLERYAIVDYGVDHADYFQGHSPYGFQHMALGAGADYREALHDAFEQAAGGDDSPNLERPTYDEELNPQAPVAVGDGMYYYVGLRWNTEVSLNGNLDTLVKTYGLRRVADAFDDAREDGDALTVTVQLDSPMENPVDVTPWDAGINLTEDDVQVVGGLGPSGEGGSIDMTIPREAWGRVALRND